MKKIIITESQLKKLLDETTTDLEVEAYHGSDSKIENFVDDFMGKEEATDQEGPGIYFSTNIEDAKAYGEYIHTAILRPKKLLDETSHENVNQDEITDLIMSAPDWETHAQNWAEDPTDGLYVAINSLMKYSKNEKDLFQQIWYDFFRYNPLEYVRGMVKMGYDGQIIKKADGHYHFIIYNPSVIEIKNIEK